MEKYIKNHSIDFVQNIINSENLVFPISKDVSFSNNLTNANEINPQNVGYANEETISDFEISNVFL